MQAIWDFLMHVVATAPTWSGPMVIAWLLAVGVTQWVKAWIPSTWSPQQRHRGTQLLALVFGLSSSWLLWPADLSPRYGAVVGLLVGLWAPFSWWLLVRYVLHRWPWLRERVSGDVEPGP